MQLVKHKLILKELTDRLSVFFKDPQLDVNIASFESQKIYLLGEVTRPMKVNIKETPLSLSDALGEVQGLSTTTSDGFKRCLCSYAKLMKIWNQRYLEQI